MAHSMIRARITLQDGRTRGPIRYGSQTLMACFARGCRIVPDPQNSYPEEWKAYEVSDADFSTVEPKGKRNRKGKP